MSIKLNVTVTPKMAEQYLKKNTHNRRPREGQIATLAQSILDGEWSETGEPIKFYKKVGDKDSVLLDGQNRLLAIIEAGRSIKLDIRDELPAVAFQYMDQAKSRTAADVLHIEGYSNTNVLAGISRTLVLYERGGIDGVFSEHGKQKSVSNHQIREFVNSNDKAVMSAMHEVVTALGQISQLFSVHGACYYLFRKRSVTDANKFLYLLSTGEKISNTHPCYQLRQILLDEKGKKSMHRGIRGRFMFIMEIKTWNLFREGRRVGNRKMLTTISKDNLPDKIL